MTQGWGILHLVIYRILHISSNVSTIETGISRHTGDIAEQCNIVDMGYVGSEVVGFAPSVDGMDNEFTLGPGIAMISPHL